MNLRENILRIKKLMLVEESDLFFGEVLSIGDSGRDVEELQNLLGIYADGEFGPQTKKCVKIFQKKVDIEDDGIIGPETSKKLSAVDSGKITVDLPQWCKKEGGKEPSEINSKSEENNANKESDKKSKNIEKNIDYSSDAEVILMGGLDYRQGDLSIGQQVNVVKKSSGLQNVIGHRYKMLNDVLSSIKKNPNAYVILFSAGCAHSRKIANAMSDKSNLYIVEPYAVDSNTKSSVRGAVNLGVPASNVIVGPTSGRGSSVVDGATDTPSGIGHWGALGYAASLLRN
jgi:hypothetical protein